MKKILSWVIVSVLLVAIPFAWASYRNERDDIKFSGSLKFTGDVLVPTETVAATNVLTALDCGKTMFLSHATEFATTLPTMAAGLAGCEYEFIVAAAPSAASYTVITGNSLENLLIGGINELEVDTTNDGPYDADGDTITFADGVAVVGDWVKIRTDGTSWFLTGQANADGGITVTKAD